MMDANFLKENWTVVGSGALIMASVAVQAFSGGFDKFAKENANIAVLRTEQRMKSLSLRGELPPCSRLGIRSGDPKQETCLLANDPDIETKVATQRFNQDCQLVVASSNTSAATTIVQGGPVIDPISKAPITGGMFCDIYGNTGKIANIEGQYVIDSRTFASGASQATVQARIQRQNQLNGTGRAVSAQSGVVKGRW